MVTTVLMLTEGRLCFNTAGSIDFAKGMTNYHIGLRGTTSAHRGQHRTTWDSIGPLRTTWDYMGLPQRTGWSKKRRDRRRNNGTDDGTPGGRYATGHCPVVVYVRRTFRNN